MNYTWFSFRRLIFSFILFSTSWLMSAQALPTIVDQHGQLRVEGSFILSENNDTVSLEGMSFFWSQWMGKYYNSECINWMKNDWHIDIVRIAMGIEHDGYLKSPKKELKKVNRVIEACINQGIYVIIDWHDHRAEEHSIEAIDFFSKMAETYGSYPNIIYEIYNEPLQISWDSIVKPYSEDVIAAIRKYDKNNIILLGTPNWAQDVDIASINPIKGENLAYTLHFYAGTHKQSYRDKAQTALDNGFALWVSEFGVCESSGDGPIDFEEMELWFAFMEQNKISWCNWSVADKIETAASLKPGASKKGGWSLDKLTESGKFIRKNLQRLNR